VTEPASPPGWFPDASVRGQLRWWDGRQWTSATQPHLSGPAPTKGQRPVWPWLVLAGAVVVTAVVVAALLASHRQRSSDRVAYQRWRALYESDLEVVTDAIAQSTNNSSLAEHRSACSEAVSTLNATAQEVEQAPTPELFAVTKAWYDATGAYLVRCEKGLPTSQAQLVDITRKGAAVAERVQEADATFGVSP
jgi:hypothetical protein